MDWGGKGQVQCQHRRRRCQDTDKPAGGGQLGSPESQEGWTLEEGRGKWGEATRGGDGAPSLTGLSRAVSQGTPEMQSAVPRSQRDGGATAISGEGTKNTHCSATNKPRTRENCLTGPANDTCGQTVAQGASKGRKESVCDQGRANTRKAARPRQQETTGRPVTRDELVLAAKPSALSNLRTRESRASEAEEGPGPGRQTLTGSARLGPSLQLLTVGG